MMDLKQLRVGYVPYNERFDQVGDWGRFVHYARKRNIRFEIAKPSETYDVVAVTERGDLSVWCNYQRGNAKVIYDIIDAYLAIPRSDIKGLLRGVAKYVVGESRHLRLNHWKAIEDMCRRSDAVVCNTEELRRTILEFCTNVHIILDLHTSIAPVVKRDYSTNGVFNFVWEGLPQNVRFFHEVRDVLTHLRRKHPIALHVVTLPRFKKYMGKYFTQHTREVVRKFFDESYVHEWNKPLLPSIVTACDMALIPIPLDDPFAAGKCENKLLIFWHLGMPTVVSATPAYTRAMDRAGLPMACRTQQEWIETLERYVADEALRREAGERGRAYVEEHHSEEKVLAQWDDLFASVLKT